MPELPEVETIRRGLEKCILNKKIVQTTILCEKSFQGIPLTGKIIKLRRYGKALILDLDNHHSLMIHLRMTGQLIYDPATPTQPATPAQPAEPTRTQPTSTAERFAAGHPSENFLATLPNKQTRVIITLDSGTLYFNDQRKFGFIKSLPTLEVEEDSFIKKLAKEPWTMPDAEFYEKLQRHAKAPIKAVILDQSIICGLGNIYADEALFASKIHPATRAGSITKSRASLLLKSAREVMEKSIASGGSTMATYVKPDGTRGDYLDQFAQVFHRNGELCPRCQKVKIEKTRVAGRGTHFCPNCQPASQKIANNQSAVHSSAKEPK